MYSMHLLILYIYNVEVLIVNIAPSFKSTVQNKQ